MRFKCIFGIEPIGILSGFDFDVFSSIESPSHQLVDVFVKRPFRGLNQMPLNNQE